MAQRNRGQAAGFASNEHVYISTIVGLELQCVGRAGREVSRLTEPLPAALLVLVCRSRSRWF